MHAGLVGRTPVALAVLGLLLSGCSSPDGHDASHEGAHDDHMAHADAAHGAAQGAHHRHYDDALALREWDPLAEPDLAHAPPFALEGGQLPNLDQAKAFKDQYGSFTAQTDKGLDQLRAEGYLTGNGSRDDPYVLDHVYTTGDLSIASTHRALVIRNSYIAGTLRLNYIGDELYVHHVYAKDLRVNENVKRTGDNTGGLFHDNNFGIVGQIRHYVGEFRNNVVGPAPADAGRDFLGDSGVLRLEEGVVFNLDGYHGADIHHNEFVGAVTIKLHGHNHGDCFTCPVHDHAAAATDPANHTHTVTDVKAKALGFATEHSIRYSSLRFRENLVRVAEGVALRYNDQNHAGDDRTANSEPSKALNDNHTHLQDVTIRDNKLEGGRLVVDVFNAADAHHPILNQGILRLQRNHLVVKVPTPGDCAVCLTQGTPMSLDGISARQLVGITLVAQGNDVKFELPEEPVVQSPTWKEPTLTGVRIDVARYSNLTFAANHVGASTYGLFARDMNATVAWRLAANTFESTHAWRGEKVETRPEETA